jgi:ABC-type multidrug transport system ATPase subunit
MSLTIEQLNKSFHTTNNKKFPALKNISLTLEPGRVHALIGQNGAGKTTLIKCLLGFLKADSGTIAIDEVPVKQMIQMNQVGYMPEVISNMGTITGRDYILDMMLLRGMKKENIENVFQELVQTFFLEKYIDIPLAHCSKGNFKKIIFLQAILHNPRLLILDEPTDGLDPISRRRMLEEINHLKNNNSYIIITTHLLSDLERVADDITVLQKGQILAAAERKDLKESIDDWYIKQIEKSGQINEL